MNDLGITPRRGAAIKSAIATPLERFAPGLFKAAHRQYRWFYYRRAEFAFCHIPKNAGSSLAINAYGRRLGHIRASEIASENDKHLPIVSITRDPLDRFESAYKYAVGGGGSDGIISDPEQYQQATSVDDFLDRFVDIPEDDRDPVFRSQSFYLDVNPAEFTKGELYVGDQGSLQSLSKIPEIARTSFNPSTRNNASVGAASFSESELARVREIYQEDSTLRSRFAEFLLDPA